MPWQPLPGQTTKRTLVDLSTVGNITFATRLTTAFNTYIQVDQICNIFKEADNASRATDRPCWLNVTSSTPLRMLPFAVVSCNWVFFTIITLASMILLVCACLNIWLNHGKFATINSALGRLERSGLLKHVKVQIRDVQQGEGVGRFALTSDIQEQRKVKKVREYV
ncbi:hypothetical protein N431DRAFT_501317 [Stipitochalara longipes BDJ]|nr:hypothetical protein N431DRAFT_501317 [Stipitochalara longipes BDJ]